jgi:hypothetical protein
MEAERSSSSPLSGVCEIRTDLLIDLPFTLRRITVDTGLLICCRMAVSPKQAQHAATASGTIAACSAGSTGETTAGCAGPADRWSVGRRGESGRRGPPVFLVRRGRDHFGLLQSISAAVVADVEQCRRRPRAVLPAHACLVSDLSAHRVLVARTKRSRCRSRGGRSSCVGQAVLVAHCRTELRCCLRDTAPGDVGGHRGSAVCVVDDGRRVADRPVRSRHTP